MWTFVWSSSQYSALATVNLGAKQSGATAQRAASCYDGNYSDVCFYPQMMHNAAISSHTPLTPSIIRPQLNIDPDTAATSTAHSATLDTGVVPCIFGDCFFNLSFHTTHWHGGATSLGQVWFYTVFSQAKMLSKSKLNHSQQWFCRITVK